MSQENSLMMLPPKPRPAPRSPPRFLIDHNPCFILAALLMFLGYLLNCVMDARAADIGKSLGLPGTINVYEAALIALAFHVLQCLHRSMP